MRLGRRLFAGGNSSKPASDPAAEAEERRAEQERKREAASRIVTIGSLVEAFLKAREQHFSPAWRVEATRYLGKSLEPLHAVPVEELSRSHIAAALDQVEKQSGATSADRAKDSLSSLLAWVVERGYRDVNPAIGIRRRVSTTSRERVLSEHELALVWNALPTGDYAAIVKLLMLTAQRRDEIADLEWQEIDFEKAEIQLPSRRTKNKRPHTSRSAPKRWQSYRLNRAIRADHSFSVTDERAFKAGVPQKSGLMRN